jgi:hypothetical protein
MRGMDSIPIIPLLLMPIVALQLAWYVAVIVFLYKIWQKVRLLPG